MGEGTFPQCAHGYGNVWRTTCALTTWLIATQGPFIGLRSC